MTTKKEGAQSPDQAAPQAISTTDSTAPETPRADLLAWMETRGTTDAADRRPYVE